MIQALNILESFDLASRDRYDPVNVHLIAEACHGPIQHIENTQNQTGTGRIALANSNPRPGRRQPRPLVEKFETNAGSGVERMDILPPGA